ncbi:hypothetical protein ACIU1J_23495 [Azospirillum doebereinerae]|uniref:hypothetical protein n=1 Tax=Azospirillum doebereinerae TaxID=92933 RepID=UPI001EE5B0E4|nr:hypothetical protein [Azospirillum doebereinerae]MCG5238746.1 hypothetical protein [Azospirillum doebereinerae]
MLTILTAMAFWTPLAEAQDLPPIDLHVYIDGSGSVFNPRNEASPHKTIVAMIKGLVDEPVGSGERAMPLIRVGSRITVSTFGGATVRDKYALTVNSARAELAASLDRLLDESDAVKTTDFGPLFESIKKSAAEWSRSDGHLHMVLIASDFIQEEAEKLRPSRKRAPGNAKADVCDYLSFPTGAHQTRLRAPLGDLATFVNQFNGDRESGYPVVFIGLRVAPAVTRNPAYDACVARAFNERWTLKAMENAPLSIETVDFDLYKQQLSGFVKRLNQIVEDATGNGLRIDEKASLCFRDPAQKTVGCTLGVVNGTDRPISLEGFSFHRDRNDSKAGGAQESRLPRPPLVLPREQRKVEVELTGADAAPFMAMFSIPVSVSNRGNTRPVKAFIKAYEDTPPQVTGKVTAKRFAADKPYRLTLPLANESGKRRKPIQVAFSSSPDGGADLGQIFAPQTDFLDTGAKVELPPLTLESSDLTSALDEGRPVYMTLRSEDERGNSAWAKPVSMDATRYGAAIVTDITAISSNGREWSLQVGMRSPDPSVRTVTDLEIYYGDDKRLLDTLSTSAIVKAAQASTSFPFPASPVVAEALAEGRPLMGAIRDSLSGKLSDRVAITRQRPERMLLKPVSARVDGNDGELLDLRIGVANEGHFNGRLSALRLNAAGGEASPVKIALGSQSVMIPRLPQGGRAAPFEIRVPVPFKDLGELAERRPLALKLVDQDGLESQEAIPIENMPGKQPLRVGDAHFGAGGPNQSIALIATVRNPASSRSTIQAVRFGADGAAGGVEVKLQSPQAVEGSVPGGKPAEARLVLPIPESLLPTINPALRQTALLVEAGQDRNAQPESFPVTALDRVSLELKNGTISQGKLVLDLYNESDHTLYFQEAWLATSALDSTSTPLKAKPLTPTPVPGKQTRSVEVLLEPDHNRVLKKPDAGLDAQPRTVWVCARSQLEETQTPPTCAVGAGRLVTIPLPSPVRLSLSPDPLEQIPKGSTAINLRLVNTGTVPNRVTAVDLWTRDVSRRLGTVLLQEEKTVQPTTGTTGGKPALGEEAKTQALPDPLFNAAYGQQSLLLCPFDETSRPGVPPNAPDTNCGPLKMDSFEFTVQDSLIQRVQIGNPPYTVVRATVKVKRQRQSALENMAFYADLRPSDDSQAHRVEVLRPEILMGLETELLLGWYLEGDITVKNPTIQFGSTTLHVKEATRKHPLTVEPIEIWMNAGLAMITAVVAMAVFFIIVLLMYFGNINHFSLSAVKDVIVNLPELVKKGRAWINMIESFSPSIVALIGAILLTNYSVISHGIIGYGYSQGTIFIGLGIAAASIVLVFLEYHLIVTWRAAVLVHKASGYVEYPRFIARRFCRGFLPTAMGTVVLVVALGWAVSNWLSPFNPKNAPYNNKTQASPPAPPALQSARLPGDAQ